MSTFTLKILALILMVIDHIGYYFEGAPLLLRMIGRLSYPLFLFCMVWGYHYTKNRTIYLVRLYLGSLFMTAFCTIVDTSLPTQGGFGFHNIFLSMFWVGVLISTIELFQKDTKKGSVALGIIFAVQVFYYIAPNFVPALRNMSGDFTTGIIPNLVLNEYGLAFIALGVLMYFLRDNKRMFAAMYILFSIGQYSEEMLMGEGFAIQWMMVFALPLMLYYNHKKGPGLKYLFYIFYPVHVFLLFYLANFVFA